MKKKITKKAERNLFLAAAVLAAVILLVLFKTANTANAGTQDSLRYKYFTSIRIEEGSTLWDIAKEYSTEEYDTLEEYIKEVKAINHLDDDLIYAGSYLCIPYYSSEYK